MRNAVGLLDVLTPELLAACPAALDRSESRGQRLVEVEIARLVTEAIHGVRSRVVSATRLPTTFISARQFHTPLILMTSIRQHFRSFMPHESLRIAIIAACGVI